MNWLPVTTWQYRWQSNETMDAIARGERVGMFTGKPSGKIKWSRKPLWGGNKE